MNSKRSYLETLNAGRQRRPYSSLEQLNRSLETLEQRIGHNADTLSDRPSHGGRDRTCPARHRSTRPRTARTRSARAGSLGRTCPARRAAGRHAAARADAAVQTGTGQLLSVAGTRVRSRPRPGGQRRRRRQDRRRAEGPARRIAPSDDDGRETRVRRAAQGYRTRLQFAADRQERRRARRRIRTPVGRHPIALGKDRRQGHQAASPRAGAGARRARFAGARGNGALGRPALGRFRPSASANSRIASMRSRASVQPIRRSRR